MRGAQLALGLALPLGQLARICGKPREALAVGLLLGTLHLLAGAIQLLGGALLVLAVALLHLLQGLRHLLRGLLTLPTAASRCCC